MSLSEWMSLVVCAGILPLVVLSLMHRGRSPMALPVAGPAAPLRAGKQAAAPDGAS